MDRVDIKQFVDDLQLGIHVKKYRVVLFTTDGDRMFLDEVIAEYEDAIIVDVEGRDVATLVMKHDIQQITAAKRPQYTGDD
jgi:hypothetical protein